MWLLTLKPRDPYLNLVFAVFLGPVIVTVGAELLGMTGANRLPLGTILNAVTVAQIFGGAVALVFIAPIMWLTLKIGFAGPLIALIVGVTPFVFMGFLYTAIILYPLASIAVFAFCAYLPTDAKERIL